MTFPNYMLGATALSAPYTLACGGWAVLLVMLCVMLVTLATGHMLNSVIDAVMEVRRARAPPLTYSSLVRYSLGKTTQKLLVLAQYTTLFLWAAGFILAMGNNAAKARARR